MRYIHSEETLEVPENGTLPIAAAFAFPSTTERPTTRPLQPTTATTLAMVLAMHATGPDRRPRKHQRGEPPPIRGSTLEHLGDEFADNLCVQQSRSPSSRDWSRSRVPAASSSRT